MMREHHTSFRVTLPTGESGKSFVFASRLGSCDLKSDAKVRFGMSSLHSKRKMFQGKWHYNIDVPNTWAHFYYRVKNKDAPKHGRQMLL
jgi:hypothetical protein